MSSESASTRVLLPHPSCERGAVTNFSVTARRVTPQRLELAFTLRANLAALELPQPGPPIRTDGLWRHTCFEVFVGRAGGSEYREFNFSPSGAWAAYEFTGYRSGMKASADAPVALWHSAGDSLELGVVIESAWFGQWPNDALRLGGSAVIESKGGALSYWALSHPSEKPDFHHADAFNLELG